MNRKKDWNPVLSGLVCFSAVLLSLLMTGCVEQHEHQPTEASCTLPSVCRICQEEIHPPTGHTLREADCRSPESCTVCGEKFGTLLGHTLLNADCELPDRCSVCEEKFGEPLGHRTAEASCDSPESCTVCGKIFSEPLGHSILPASCETAAVCPVCGTEFDPPTGHETVPADCTTAETCRICQKVFGEPLGHTAVPASCEMPSVCSVCSEVLVPASGHSYTAAGCETASVCSVCGKEGAPAFGHSEIPASCESGGVCQVCGMILSQPLGHDVLAATCVTDEHCLRCGTFFAYAYGHSWQKTELTPSTCTSNGVVQYACLNCGYSYTETVYAGGHEFWDGSECWLCGCVRTYLSVPMLWQGDAYPNGCESVSAVMVMQYAGAQIGVDTFIDECLPRRPYIDYSGEYPVAADPEYYYLGDPRDYSGLYCFENALAVGVNNSGAGISGTALRGRTLEALCSEYIDRGIPVIVWTTLYMDRRENTQIAWQIEGTENWHTLISNLHCVVMTGYDEEHYYINDPLFGPGAYPKETMNASYCDLGMRALVIQ